MELSFLQVISYKNTYMKMKSSNSSAKQKENTALFRYVRGHIIQNHLFMFFNKTVNIFDHSFENSKFVRQNFINYDPN